MSDTQRGLVPAIASRFPTTPHQFCQSHYLRNLAEPLASADTSLNHSLHQSVRQSLGTLLLVEAADAPVSANVLTITGVLPNPLPASLSTSLATTDRSDPVVVPFSAADSPAADNPAAAGLVT